MICDAHTTRLIIGVTGLALIALALTPALSAQVPTQSSDEVIVPAGTSAGSNGRIAINIAAGTGNQQLGDAIVATGNIALASEVAVQRSESMPQGDRTTAVTLQAGAFSRIGGLTSVNVTAGSQNQMANLAALAIGDNGALSDQLLEQSRAPTEPKGGGLTTPLSSNDRVDVSDTALGNGSGLIQVNLIGGEGNTSANTFALTVTGEG